MSWGRHSTIVDRVIYWLHFGWKWAVAANESEVHLPLFGIVCVVDTRLNPVSGAQRTTELLKAWVYGGASNAACLTLASQLARIPSDKQKLTPVQN